MAESLLNNMRNEIVPGMQWTIHEGSTLVKRGANVLQKISAFAGVVFAAGTTLAATLDLVADFALSNATCALGYRAFRLLMMSLAFTGVKCLADRVQQISAPQPQAEAV